MNRNVLFTGAILVVGVVYLAMALQMPRGSIAFPGPGFYPSGVGLFLVVTAGFCFGRALLRARKEAAAVPASSAPKRVVTPTLQLLALLVLYASSLPYLGFLPAIFLFLLCAMRIFGYRHWGRSVLITGVIVAVSYITFVYWLSVPLPRGVLGEYM
jgi:putative tricarboxylic transport membrane protein